MIQEIAYGSDLYRDATRLRDDHLRRPLGLRLADADVTGEDQQIHVVAVDAGAVVGTVILKPLSRVTVKLRQVVVAQAARGTGLGGRLMRFAEDLAAARGFTRIELTARVDAQGFYEKLGYASTGERSVEVGLPHVKMTKRLDRKPQPR